MTTHKSYLKQFKRVIITKERNDKIAKIYKYKINNNTYSKATLQLH